MIDELNIFSNIVSVCTIPRKTGLKIIYVLINKKHYKCQGDIMKLFIIINNTYNAGSKD